MSIWLVEVSDSQLDTFTNNLPRLENCTRLHVCASHKKPKKLVSTLERIYKRKDSSDRFVNNQLCIVFFAQVKTLKFTQKLLLKEGLRCAELYGTLNQAERERRLLEFRAGKIPILLATDVVARGIHIPNVTYAM